MIAHIDADSFFASVLVRTHPHLRGKPLLVIGMGGGCVIAATYEAKAKGVKTGMRLRDARLLVPEAIEMPCDFRETGIASKQIESILRDHCPLIEQMSIDEWFLDLRSLVGGVPQDPGAWAQQLRTTILQKTDLSMSVGTATTKTLSKMASEYHKPGGIFVVKNNNTKEFLENRPAAAIPGIGRKRIIEAEARGWKTAWEFTQAPDDVLKCLFGCTGVELKAELLGMQMYPIDAADRAPKSISRCRTFRATTDTSVLRAHLLRHLEYCTMKMRRLGLQCGGISVHVRTADFHYAGWHHRFDTPKNTADGMMPEVLRCLRGAVQPGIRYGQVGLALIGLTGEGRSQPSLFDDPQSLKEAECVQAALDDLHTRFGRDSVTRGSALGVRSGTELGLEFSFVE
jgi:nucleotidyltransferase/DNA polymerase involved in DNA repair